MTRVTLTELVGLSTGVVGGKLRRWWYSMAESHYLMCAEVEQQRVREAQSNVAYYQKQAALARSAKH